MQAGGITIYSVSKKQKILEEKCCTYYADSQYLKQYCLNEYYEKLF